MKEMSFSLSVEWKVEAVIGDESEGGDCDEVIQESCAIAKMTARCVLYK